MIAKTSSKIFLVNLNPVCPQAPFFNVSLEDAIFYNYVVETILSKGRICKVMLQKNCWDVAQTAVSYFYSVVIKELMKFVCLDGASFIKLRSVLRILLLLFPELSRLYHIRLYHRLCCLLSLLWLLLYAEV